ncbi:Uncharacterized conserved protein YafD, endonuclease/exonuclease/phosphatase (EEP) superfamily [Catalinimonas alkaloidigena]|uniref:Uncharacterized conserved protein YafD, endonuclease/exonuclease/phosphatase (EEP) superfamily n=1 Tax=Catalinimonas alkaloidigena TaxID=1075417 RepID=A0A1G9AGS7_9BACT|nr:endonuclease/exonuclease/phosphatase family protein [Catalinimonas alkaloidigena]SDK26547.1 Uncharacterized conserved protein YafD, endonuclease/exonuclease/phosphatase (EEP) superfamily [Catalinimonas alkaloidigena]
MEYLLFFLSGLFLLISVLPLFRTDFWWVRVWDFPRAQIFLFSAILLGFNLWYLQFDGAAPVVFTVLLAAAMIYQGVMIAPFTPFYPKQATSAKHPDDECSFTLVEANVRMENKETEAFVELAKEVDPDILVVNEPNQWWADRIQELDDRYPFCVKNPLDNTYGMILYSKLPLIDPTINYLVDDEVPSIHTFVELPNKARFELYCVHPQPPEIGSNTDDRDAELLIVAKKSRKSDVPTIVTGDLNDVAWSFTTKLFQKISHMVDPRVGRGFFNTYNAHIPFFRYPLDHVFYSPKFTLIRMERLRKYGSDHYPILISLCLQPEREQEQDTPVADAEDKEIAEEMIQKPFEQEN